MKAASTNTQYQLIETTKSRCPNCGDTVVLLQHSVRPKRPMFYICFPCGMVFEVGKSEVLYAEEQS